MAKLLSWGRDLFDPNTEDDKKRRLAQGKSEHYVRGESALARDPMNDHNSPQATQVRALQQQSRNNPDFKKENAAKINALLSNQNVRFGNTRNSLGGLNALEQVGVGIPTGLSSFSRSVVSQPVQSIGGNLQAFDKTRKLGNVISAIGDELDQPFQNAQNATESISQNLGVAGKGTALAGQMAGQLAGAAATGGMLPLATGYSQVAAPIFKNSQQQGIDPRKAAIAANIAGIPSAALNKFSVSQALKPTGALAGNAVGRIVTAAGAGGLENSVSQLAANQGARMSYNPNQQLTEGVGDAAKMGAITAGAVRTGIELPNMARPIINSVKQARIDGPKVQLQTEIDILRDMKDAEMRAKGPAKVTLKQNTLAQQEKVNALKRDINQGGYVALPGRSQQPLPDNPLNNPNNKPVLPEASSSNNSITPKQTRPQIPSRSQEGLTSANDTINPQITPVKQNYSPETKSNAQPAKQPQVLSQESQSIPKQKTSLSQITDDQSVLNGSVRRKLPPPIPETPQSAPSHSSDLQRGFIKTVLEDSNTSPKVKQSISSLYKVRNTGELQTKAATFVKEHGDLAEQMARSTQDDTSVAIAMELVKKHQNSGDYTRAIELVESVSKDLTEAGRTVQAASIYGRLTPDGVLRFTQKEINNYNKATGKSVKLTPDAAKRIKDMSESVHKLPEGYDKEVAIKLLVKEIQETMPATLAEKVSTFQTMAQLLNPKTIIRNEVGNRAFRGLENISQSLATPVDTLLSLFTNKRTTTLPSLTTQAKGAWGGRKKGIKESFQGINTGAVTQYELNSVPAFRGKVLGSLEKTMGAALRGGDRANYTAAFDDSLKGSMKLAKASKATPEMMEQAHHAGLYRTFQDTNTISNFFTGMKQTLNKVGFGQEGKRFGLGDMVIKYPKTPANLLARGIDYSPGGFVKTVFEASRPLFGKQFDQKAFVDSFSRATTGTAGLVGTGIMLGSLGIITEAPEKDRDLRDLQKESGLGGYQINVSALKRFVTSGLNKDAAKLREEDTLISYDWAQPAAIPVSMGAAIGKGKNAKDGAGKSANALAEGVNTITEQPMVRGLQQFFGSNQGAGGVVGNLVKDTPASFVPTLSNQVRQLTDNTSRNTYDPSTSREMLNKVLNRIPGLADNVAERVGTLGEARENYQNGSNNPVNVFLNPAFVNKYQPSSEAKLPLDIYNNSGETKQAPRSVTTYQTVNGENIKTTAKQNEDLQRYVGQTTKEVFGLLNDDPVFLAMSDEDKAKKMSSLLTDINKAGKILLLGDEAYGTEAYNPSKLSKGVRDVFGGTVATHTPEKTPKKVTSKKRATKKSSRKTRGGRKSKTSIADISKAITIPKIGKIATPRLATSKPQARNFKKARKAVPKISRKPQTLVVRKTA